MRGDIKEAIQEDVSEEKDEVVEEKLENPRELAVEAIVAENRKADSFEEPEEEPEPIPEEEVLEAEEEEEEEEEEFVTLTSDGKEIQVEMSKIIDAGKRTYQKETTGDARLEEASERMKEINRLEAELAEREKYVAPLADGDNTSIGKKFTAAVFEDEGVAEQVLDTVDSRIKFLEDKLALQEQRTELNAEQEQQKIVNYYHNTYDEIASDQDMHDMLVLRTKSHQRDDPSLSPQEAIDEAAKDVNRFYGKEVVSTEKTPPVRTTKRAGVQKRELNKPPPKPQTTDEILAEMQVARGRRATL